ncbi:coiled-coil domain-containing protein 115 [Stegostoma tigrinum]|uniref:coiled-coil domain-containing protein 115 n=1 Tax=Stegostoma tigrinum TaxID=3053191 RepID=UPI002870570D|nr:coiled-coil domain-containing protein 115 [Stegostoma tigrinum]
MKQLKTVGLGRCPEELLQRYPGAGSAMTGFSFNRNVVLVYRKVVLFATKNCFLLFTVGFLVFDTERTVDAGWFLLSKARYSMGNKCVSSLQYGPQMEPLAQVHVSQNEDGYCNFKVERVSCGELTNTGGVKEEQKEILEIGAQEQVRRRKTRWKEQEEQKLRSDELVGDLLALKENPGEEDKPVGQGGGHQSCRDPLRWFGVLVPQSLRDAQASFKEVMELAAEVATLQSSLMSTKAEYQALLQQKHKLIGCQSV